MSRHYARICVVLVCGLAVAAGCYRESTIEQINRLPAKRPGAKTVRATSRPGGAPRTVGPAGTRDPKVRQAARQARQFSDRVRSGRDAVAARPKPGESARLGDRRRPSTTAGDKTVRPGALASIPPGDSKRAVHVAQDTFETKEVEPMTAAKTTGKAPWRRSDTKAPAAPVKASPTAPKPPPKVRAPDAKTRIAAKTDSPSAVAVKPEAPIVSPSPSTPRPVIAKETKPSPPKSLPMPGTPAADKSKAGARDAARPKASMLRPPPSKPLVSPALADKPKTPPGESSRFKVPEPPKIETTPARKRRERAGKAPALPPAAPRVTVRSRQEPKARAEPTKTARPNQPAKAAPPAERDVKAVIREKLEELAANPNDLKKQMTLRLLYLANKEPKKALAEIPGTNAQVQAIIDKLMRVNITAFQSEARDTAVAATKMLSDVEALRKLLMRHADLEVASIKLCTKVEGFGVFEEIKPRRFPAGRRNRAIVYCEVKNFTSVPTEDSQFRVLLAQKIKLLNTGGETVYETADDDIPYVSRQRLEDFFLVQLVDLPADLPEGKYILRVYVEDKLAAKAREGQIELTLTPKAAGG